MKKIGFICILLIVFTPLMWGQEGSVVHKRLKEKYGFASFHSDGWYSVCLGKYQYGKGGNEGACDINGKEIIPCRYDAVTFHPNKENGGYYGCELNGKCGAYDIKGKMIIPCEYTDITYCKNFFEVSKGVSIGKDPGYSLDIYGGPYGVFDINGKEVIPCIYSNPYLAYQVAYSKTGYIIVNKGGIVTSDHRVRGGKWGMINMINEMIIPCDYSAIWQPTEGLSIICKGGECIYEPYFNAQKQYLGGKYGFYNVTSKTIAIPIEYDKVTAFSDGVSLTSKDGESKLMSNPISGTNSIIGSGLITTKSDIDDNIPTNRIVDDNTFVFIFSVEHYSEGKNAMAAIRDGEIFRDYCKKTLGIPQQNISYYENGTFAQFNSMVKRIKDVEEVVERNTRFIVYFSGLGFTDSNAISYLLPSDVSWSNICATSYKMTELCDKLSSLPSVLLIIDAPLNGNDRNGKNIISGRGISIKAREPNVRGNFIILSASDSGVAYLNKDNSHGLMTYFFLKKIQATKGHVKLAALFSSTISETANYSLRNSHDGVIQKPVLKQSEKCSFINELLTR